MFTKVPLVYYNSVLFLVSLASLAVVITRPPFRVSMPFFAFQITVGIVALVRAMAEQRREKK